MSPAGLRALKNAAVGARAATDAQRRYVDQLLAGTTVGDLPGARRVLDEDEAELAELEHDLATATAPPATTEEAAVPLPDVDPEVLELVITRTERLLTAALEVARRTGQVHAEALEDVVNLRHTLRVLEAARRPTTTQEA